MPLTKYFQPLSEARRDQAIVGLLALYTLLVVVVERDWSASLFAFASLGAIAALLFVISLRPLFSLFSAVLLLVAIMVVDVCKYRMMSINAQVFDLFFYFSHADTFFFLVDEYRLLVGGILLALVAAPLAAFWSYRLDRPATLNRGGAGLLASISLAGSVMALPAESKEDYYYFAKRHFITAPLASLSDLSRLSRANSLFDRLPKNAPALRAGLECSAAAARPDIVVVLSESATPPAEIAGWRRDPDIDARFRSWDGAVHRLRVETYGGGTWITTAGLFTGMSMADLGWMRAYAPMFLKDKVHNSLAAYLKRCGYRTAVVSPEKYLFVNEGPFMTSLGVDAYLDSQSIHAPSKHEEDSFYLGKALEFIKRRHRADPAPVFLFVMTMAAHSPYDFKFAPDRAVKGFPFGNSPGVDEYLRRLTLAQEDFAQFASKLKAEAAGRPTLLVQFGDHHPIVTLPDWASEAGARILADWRSPMYETFYSVLPFNMPARPLPKTPALDAAYLGVTLLQAAGLPLDPQYSAAAALRDRCGGAFHSCADRPAVDAYLAGLAAGGGLDVF